MFKCPFCQMESHNPKDEAERYCANCRVSVDDVMNSSPAVCGAMAHFYEMAAELNPKQAAGFKCTARVWKDAKIRKLLADVLKRGPKDAAD